MSRPALSAAALAQLATDVGAEALPALIEDFLAELRRLLAGLVAAKAEDRARLAHRLCGMAESFGALALADAAGRLEHAVGDAALLAALLALAGETEAAYRRALAAGGAASQA